MLNLYLKQYFHIPNHGIGKLINIDYQNYECSFYFPENHNTEYFSIYDNFQPILRDFNRFRKIHFDRLAQLLKCKPITHYDIDKDVIGTSWEDEELLTIDSKFKVYYFSEGKEKNVSYQTLPFLLQNRFGCINENDILGNSVINFDEIKPIEPEIWLDFEGIENVKTYKFKDFKDDYLPYGTLVDRWWNKSIGLIVDEESVKNLEKLEQEENNFLFIKE